MRILSVLLLVSALGFAQNCATNPALGDLTSKPSWNGWGAGISNARRQSAAAAGLEGAQIANLKLKWAFGFPRGAGGVRAADGGGRASVCRRGYRQPVC